MRALGIKEVMNKYTVYFDDDEPVKGRGWIELRDGIDYGVRVLKDIIQLGAFPVRREMLEKHGVLTLDIRTHDDMTIYSWVGNISKITKLV